MNYCNIYFKKDLNDLTYTDIKNFFGTEKLENETIEFKSFHPNAAFEKEINNVIIGIDAFLNSEGGILIWGAPKGLKLPNRKELSFVGDLSPLKGFKEKDELINIISGRISPLPIGINVAILEANSEYVYVFEIQPSQYKPHQFSDKYYVRLDGQSKPAPYYLIEALMKKITFPDVAGYIKFERIQRFDHGYNLNFSVFLCNFSKFQNEENASFQLVVFPGNIYPRLGGAYYSKEHSVLHYGRPYRENHDMFIDMIELDKYDYYVKFSLNFGGKYSPAKSSNYTLNFWQQPSTPKGQNANILIAEL
jgi:hypothetical protein